MSITDIITVPFGIVLDLLYRLTSNYGLAIILFSGCVSLLLHPIRMKNAVNGAKKARLQPKVRAIREMFPGNTEVWNKVMGEMYEKEGVSPSMGCITFVVPFVILISLYAVISQPVVNMLGVSRETAVGIFELMKKLSPAIFGEAGTYNEMIVAQNIPNFVDEIRTAFPEVGERALEGINFHFFGLNLAQVPELDSSQWASADWNHIGLVILPLTAAVCHSLPSLVKSFILAFFPKRIASGGSEAPTKKTGFDFATPLMLVLFTVACFQVPAALSLYWLTQSMMSMILQMFIDRQVRNLPPEVTDLKTLTEPYREIKKD